MTLKIAIEDVRKNPKSYLGRHMSSFHEDLDSLTAEALLCLQFSSASFASSDYFEIITEAINHQGIPEKLPIYDHYYAIALGLFARSINDTTEALTYFTKAYDIAVQLGDKELIARSLIYLSTIFDMLKNSETAIDFATKAVRLTTTMSSNLVIAEVYMNYALLLEHSGQAEDAIAAYQYAHNHFSQVPDQETFLNYCILTINIGHAYLEQGMQVMGEQYLTQAITIADTYGFFPYLQRSIKVIAAYFENQNEFEKANHVLNLFLESQLKSQKSANTRSVTVPESDVKKHLGAISHLEQVNTQLSFELKVIQNVLTEDSLAQKMAIQQLKTIGEAIRNREFLPYLQAKWPIKTDQFAGAEILARWQSSEGGMIPPSQFIDAIENNDLIIGLSEYLLRTTLDTLAPIIRQAYPTFVISLNVSPYQLAHQDILRLLDACCIEYGLLALNFEIEIIERTFIENNPKAIDQLFKLHQKGFGIALDDFGSGYSSLACIIELPIDTVKIDRSLVKNLDETPKSRQLFTSIISMLSELGIKSIAEGIETESQRLFIEESGCLEGQGFLVHKPCCLDDFHAILKKE